MIRFPDCESCAFYKVEEAICDECIDADQWECDDSSNIGITTSDKNTHTGAFFKRKLKEAA